MKNSSFVVFALLLAFATSIQVNDDGKRQFIPSDLTGVYEIFVKQGQCPKEIIHKEFVGLQRGAYQIPHKKIQQDGNPCTGNGALTVVSKRAIEATGQNTSLLRTGPIAQVIEALESQGTEYMVGYEFDPRTCGDSTVSARTTFVFLEDEKQLKIPELIDLFPGAKYMIMYDESSSTPCTYAAKSSESIIGNPAPSPRPVAAGEPIADESEEIEGSSGPVLGVPGSDDSESDGSSTGGSGEPGSAGSGANSDATSEGAAGSGKRGANGDATPDGTGSASSSGSDTTGAASGPSGSDSTTGSSVSSEGASTDSVDRGTITGTGSDSESIEEGGLITGEEFPEESPEEEDTGSVCFPRDMTVTLENGDVRRMDEVAIGDRVLIGNGKFSEVFMFTHQSSSKRTTFIRLTTKSEQSIELTPEHYIYSNSQLVTAKNVHVGDMLLLKDGTSSEVVEISSLRKDGVYNPQTAHGDIIVDGILASTFTSTVNPGVAQPLLAPFRSLYNAFGITCAAFNNGASILAGFLSDRRLTL